MHSAAGGMAIITQTTQSCCSHPVIPSWGISQRTTLSLPPFP